MCAAIVTLLSRSFQAHRFTHYVEIDVRGLNVVKGRDGVFVVPNQYRSTPPTG